MQRRHVAGHNPELRLVARVLAAPEKCASVESSCSPVAKGPPWRARVEGSRVVPRPGAKHCTPRGRDFSRRRQARLCLVPSAVIISWAHREYSTKRVGLRWRFACAWLWFRSIVPTALLIFAGCTCTPEETGPGGSPACGGCLPGTRQDLQSGFPDGHAGDDNFATSYFCRHRGCPTRCLVALLHRIKHRSPALTNRGCYAYCPATAHGGSRIGCLYAGRAVNRQHRRVPRIRRQWSRRRSTQHGR
jgi:hypothetical protein